MRIVVQVFLLSILFFFLPYVAAGQPAKEGFTLQQVMSAPFNSDLTAAPVNEEFAWVSNVEGKRNVWVARRSADGAKYVSNQVTNYLADDGQAINDLTWSPDGK
jgi:hypothetical protein